MKILDWDIPENDDREPTELTINVMQKAIDKLKSGDFDYY